MTPQAIFDRTLHGSLVRQDRAPPVFEFNGADQAPHALWAALEAEAHLVRVEGRPICGNERPVIAPSLELGSRPPILVLRPVVAGEVLAEFQPDDVVRACFSEAALFLGGDDVVRRRGHRVEGTDASLVEE